SESRIVESELYAILKVSDVKIIDVHFLTVPSGIIFKSCYPDAVDLDLLGHLDQLIGWLPGQPVLLLTYNGSESGKIDIILKNNCIRLRRKCPQIGLLVKLPQLDISPLLSVCR